jgi:hypothetical protein
MLSPAQAGGYGPHAGRAVGVLGALCGFPRRVDLMGERGQNRAQRAVVVHDTQDQPGQTNGCQDAVGHGEEPQADPEPAFDDL